jgi:hypothetical protein
LFHVLGISLVLGKPEELLITLLEKLLEAKLWYFDNMGTY